MKTSSTSTPTYRFDPSTSTLYVPEEKHREIRRHCEELNDLKALFKRRSMIYQVDLKESAMQAFGLKMEQVNIAYPEWAKIRDLFDKFIAEKNKKKKLTIKAQARKIARSYKRPKASSYSHRET